MKKILASLALLMLLSSVAYAENTAIVNNEAATVDIDFETPGARFALVMIKNRDTGKYIWAGQETVNGGKIDFTATFDPDADGGDYDVIVTTDNKKSYSASFYYLTEGEIVELLGDINALVDSSDEERETDLREIIESKQFIFQYSTDKYTYLEDKAAVMVEMLKTNYTSIDDFSKKLDDVITQAYDKQKDNEAAKKLSSASVDEITGLLEEYEDVFGIKLDDTYYKYKNAVNADIKAAGIKRSDEVFEVYQRAMAVPYVNEADRYSLLDVIEAYDEYLDIYETITSLEGNVQVAVLKALESGNFKNVSEMKAAISKAEESIDENVADYSDDEEALLKYTVNQDVLDRRVELVQDMVTEDDFNQDKAFTDLKDSAWAEEAILALYDMGIVSGKGEKKFAPNDVISRAELITMIVKAYKLDAVASEEFLDVNSGDWYYDSVMTAKAAGIASGDEENCFNPNASVTRQDMAVLIYRAMGQPEAEETELFSDDSLVSDYAKEAVYCLKELNIVNGMENGEFAPLATATRAQCAKILYSVLKADLKEE